MSDEPLLRIGPFSRASSLSVKALRAYHESGLLVPAVVDPSSGYRSYTAAQLTDAAVIHRLRQLDVPLEAIRQVLDARDPDVTRKVLAEHGAILEQRLATMQRAIDDLYVAVDAPGVHTPVERRREPARTVLAFDQVVSVATFEAAFDAAREALVEAARVSGAVVDGPFGGSYPTLFEDDEQEVSWFLPVAGAPLLPASLTGAGIRVGELPAGEVAVLVHKGPYEGIEDTYRHLGTWVAAHATPTDEAVREVYTVSCWNAEDEADFRTEICWPVVPAALPAEDGPAHRMLDD